MKNKKSEELEQQLDTLREQQANLVATDQGDSPQAQTLARQIMTVASQLGFDADEAAEIAAKIDAPATGPAHAMAGEYKVLRGSAEPILSFSALVIAAAVISLDQPIVGVGIIFAVVASWFIRSARRLARLRIDPASTFGFPGHVEQISWDEIVRIDFAYRYPWAASRLRRAAFETVILRLRLRGDRSVQLARGPLWRIRPQRAPIAYAQLERWLLAQVRHTGMKIQRTGSSWTARR